MTNPGAQSGQIAASASSLRCRRSDPNGDALRYAASGLPPGLSLSTTHAACISGTPTAAGSYNVVVTASDGINVASANFVWTVNDDNVRRASPPPPVPSAAGRRRQASFTASAQGGGNVRYRWNFGDGTRRHAVVDRRRRHAHLREPRHLLASRSA